MLSISRFAPIAEAVIALADQQLAGKSDTDGVAVVLEGERAAELEPQYRAAPERTETLLRFAVEEWAEPHPSLRKFSLRFGTVSLHLR